MERSPLSSGNLASAGYDDGSATLEVEFKNSHVYQYFDVPRAVYEELTNASSPGNYLAKEIKGRYRYIRL